MWTCHHRLQGYLPCGGVVVGSLTRRYVGDECDDDDGVHVDEISEHPQ